MATHRPHMAPNTGNEEVPPGATRKAFERDRPSPNVKQSPSEQRGAGPRHAAGDQGSAIESYGPGENEPNAEPPREPLDRLEKGPPYAGPSGGAVGGTPAEGRSTGGNVRGGLAPGGTHRGDSTIGANPDPSKEQQTIRLTGFDAIEYAERKGLKLNKHPDQTSGPRIGLSIAEAEAIATEDESLIWVEVTPDDPEYYENATDMRPER